MQILVVWVVVSIHFFHPYLPGEMILNLIYAYFSKWSGSKTIN